MAERKNAKALACSSLQERPAVNLDVPLQGRSAAPAPSMWALPSESQREGLDGSRAFLVSPPKPGATQQTRAEPALEASMRGLELTLGQQGQTGRAGVSFVAIGPDERKLSFVGL